MRIKGVINVLLMGDLGLLNQIFKIYCITNHKAVLDTGQGSYGVGVEEIQFQMITFA